MVSGSPVLRYLAIDVADLETREFGASHAGSVECHQQRPSKKVSGTIDQLRDFLLAQHRRQPTPVPGGTVRTRRN